MEEQDYLRIMVELQNIILKLQERVHKLDERLSEIEQASEETAMDEAASEILKDLKTPMIIHHNIDKTQIDTAEPDVARIYQ